MSAIDATRARIAAHDANIARLEAALKVADAVALETAAIEVAAFKALVDIKAKELCEGYGRLVDARVKLGADPSTTVREMADCNAAIEAFVSRVATL